MKTNPFARLFAVLGVAALVGVLLYSRDGSLKHREAPAQPTSSVPANAQALSPSIEVLAETPAPEAPKAEPAQPAKP